MSALFRPAAVSSSATSNQYRDALGVMRPRLWAGGLFLVVLILGALVWSALFRVPVSVTGQGILLAPGGMIDVVADAAGQVLALDAAPGTPVAEGAVVARIAQPDLELKRDIARAERADALRFRDDLIRFQAADDANRARLRAAREASLAERIQALELRGAALRDQQANLRRLLKTGNVTRDRLLQVDQEVLAVESSIADARDERVAMQAEAALQATEREKARLEAERRLAEAERELAALDQQLARSSKVRSPFAGRVVEAKVNVGQMVQPGTAMVTLERQAEPADGRSTLPYVTAYVTAADGKKIRAGQPVEISPATTRREEHGFLRGHVVHVSDVPASSAGMLKTLQNDRLVQTFQDGMGAPFEVTVAIDPDPARPDRPLWSSPRAHPPRIEPGTLAELRFTIRSGPLLALAIPALQYAGPDVPRDGR
ncbi:NHLP bacteriocin system secretion protein [uncultured Tistrella sp.]|uniref:NHLP bacteriocin system secretion protein n=1 Tax=Tistrella mobilis TaxID=171437 RepID=UPI0026214B31|nr:NHLP bacteriocin system secretion protein [uncultured Tistrella sp.]